MGDVDPLQLVLVITLVLTKPCRGITVIAEDHGLVVKGQSGNPVRPPAGSGRSCAPGISAYQVSFSSDRGSRPRRNGRRNRTWCQAGAARTRPLRRGDHADAGRYRAGTQSASPSAVRWSMVAAWWAHLPSPRRMVRLRRVHFCLGSQLARMEQRSLFFDMQTRLPTVALGTRECSSSSTLHGIKRMSIRRADRRGRLATRSK